MEITWYGLTCFRLSERGLANVVTDPCPPEVGFTYPKPSAQVVTVSYDDPACRYTSGVRGPFKLLDGPGEYEVGGVFVTCIVAFADGKRGATRGQNNVFTFDLGGLTVCHLGLLGHVPTQSQVESLGTVNVLLVPVGGGGSLTPARASEVISLFEPNTPPRPRANLPLPCCSLAPSDADVPVMCDPPSWRISPFQLMGIDIRAARASRSLSSYIIAQEAKKRQPAARPTIERASETRLLLRGSLWIACFCQRP